MSEQSLISLLETQRTEADHTIGKVGAQRQRNYRYYSMQPFGNEQEGRSQYVSPDVFDVVEGRKTYFSETFFSGRQAVKFVPSQTVSKEEADQKTAYVQQTLDRNDWFCLARDGWHDAMNGKRMVVLVEWQEDDETEDYEVQGITPLQLQQATQADPSIIDLRPTDGDVQTVPIGGSNAIELFTGTLEVTRDTSYVGITLMEPEAYFRDPTCAYVKDAMYAGYDEELPRTEALKRGYDPEAISGLARDTRPRHGEEESSRKAHDGSWTTRQLRKRSDETELLTITRQWAWVDLSEHLDDAPEGVALYEIHWASNQLLYWDDGSPAVRPADELPFIEWTEYKVSHAEHGMSSADVVAGSQLVNSTLKRLILDNQQQRNNPRWAVMSGGLKNPRELLSGRIGSIVWQRRAGSVEPLQTPDLSPHTFHVIEQFARDKEERSGLSRLAQGMNTDAVRYQNAADMIERLTNAGNRRVMAATRDFAKDFMTKLAHMIVRLGTLNDRGQYQVEIAGEQVMFSPSSWSLSRTLSRTHPALTPDEGQRYAQALLMMDAQMTAKMQVNPAWQHIYGVEQQHALYDDVFDALGVTDTSRYMGQPDSPEVQQALQQQQAAMMQMAQAQQEQNQLMMAQMQDQSQREWYRARLDGQELMLKATDMAADNTREDRELEHKMDVDEKELELEEQQGRDVARSTNVASG